MLRSSYLSVFSFCCVCVCLRPTLNPDWFYKPQSTCSNPDLVLPPPSFTICTLNNFTCSLVAIFLCDVVVSTPILLYTACLAKSAPLLLSAYPSQFFFGLSSLASLAPGPVPPAAKLTRTFDLVPTLILTARNF